MARILGLDLGTNSIGWAVAESGDASSRLIGSGSRIIPMTQDVMGKFTGGGNIETQTKARTTSRGARRLVERNKLRRERLLRVLNILGFLPPHFAKDINFDKSKSGLGKIKDGSESKIAWVKSEDGTYEFLFKESFEQMLSDFRVAHPSLPPTAKIPYDWTLYFLRKKALTQPISSEELAWVLLSFNQKRGYYQLRGEEESDKNPCKLVEYHKLKVVDVKQDNEGKGKDMWYSVYLENGWIYRRSSKTPLFDWAGKTREFIVTTDINEDGSIKTDKDGAEKRSFRAPAAEDWTLLKKRTEQDIQFSGKHVGEYIYDHILENPEQKIRGSLVRTVERYFYKDELRAILKTQVVLNPALQSRELYKAAIEELYSSNVAYRNSISSRDFYYLLLDDIIFYQRPLKSKKSLIDDCPYESRSFRNKEGEIEMRSVKCVAKSNPLFQEFRLLQFVQNLRILSTDDNKDITEQFLPSEQSRVEIYNWLNNREAIKQDTLFSSYFKCRKAKGAKSLPYRWNYVEDKEYPCNSTHAIISSNLAKCGESKEILSRSAISREGNKLDHNIEYALWHILYSVEDKYEIVAALNSFATKYNLGEAFVNQFKKIKPFEKAYGAYSEKAIKKLLPLMRMGRSWNIDDIDKSTQVRLSKIINGEYDENIKERLYRLGSNYSSIEDFKNIPLWLACYLVYGRHSEAKDTTKWKNPHDMQCYIDSFKQHSLRNPIVEQITLETLRTVKDIWSTFGNLDEIHIELGREIKQPKKQREIDAKRNAENENTNLRIKAILMELKDDSSIENVRPMSPSQQMLLKIYEQGALLSSGEVPDYIEKISRSSAPTSSEINRYKLWLGQRYRSPYTGEVIPLSRLFTSNYEIEHVVPRKLYFDDSFSNKVICEAEVNSLKGARLAMNFIEAEHGRVVTTSRGDVRIFTSEEYEEFVKLNYSAAHDKRKHLLMREIPDGFTSRQLNDSRYISKLVMSLMSNIVRSEKEGDIAISSNVITCNGAITTRLKQDWGLNDIWNKIVTPRFERMNHKTNSEDYGHWECREGKNIFLAGVPLAQQRGFNKKRIDHRHHALDAIVIAMATRNHINYLNNESAHEQKGTKRDDLQHALCEKVHQNNRGGYVWRFKKPWPTFTQDCEAALRDIVVSFKQNIRVITRTNNRTAYIDNNGRKAFKMQEGENLAIRKSLHKDTVYGRVNLRLKKFVSLKDAIAQPQNIVDSQFKASIKEMLASHKDAKSVLKIFKELDYKWCGSDVTKVEIYYFTDDSKEPMVATREALDDSFNSKKIATITDTGIQKILTEWLLRKGGDPKVAFSPEGIAEMNSKIKDLNNGKNHKPILKARVSTAMGIKFNVGERGNRASKYVIAGKGTNLFCAIYDKGEGNRATESIPLDIVIERLKQKLPPVPETNASGCKLLFSISPNDLVYIPTKDQIGTPLSIADIDKERIYKMVSTSGSQCFFIKSNVATSIVDKAEFSSHNKMERSLTDEMIKDCCLKIEVNRLGKITKIYNL